MTELTTGEVAVNFAETPAAGVACKRGDRLRVRVFGDDAGTMGTGFTFTFRFDGATGATGDSYLTLTETLSFVSEPAGTTIYPTDTAGPTASAPTLISDFTGGDETPISEGGNWAALGAGTGFRRLSNEARPAASVQSRSYWTAADFGPDLEMYATIRAMTTGVTQQLVFRLQSPDTSGYDGYRVALLSAVSLFRMTDGGSTAISTTHDSTPTWAVGDKIGVRMTGSLLEVYRWPSGGSAWALVCHGTDATWAAAGKIGFVFLGTATNGGFDDLYAGTNTSVFAPPVTREAWTSRGAGVQTDSTNTVAGWTAPIQITDTAGGTAVEWYTKPLTAFTLGGAVRVNARTLESNALANISTRCEIARTALDGTGATIWAASTIPAERGTSEAAESFLISGDDLAVSDGQRLRIRFYIDDSAAAAMAASYTGTFYYAGTSGGASGDTWLKFTQTLTEFATSTAEDSTPRPQGRRHRRLHRLDSPARAPSP